MDQAGGGAGLAGHAAVGILLEDRVQNRVGDLVADLIGMSLGNGFRSKQMSCHGFFLLSALRNATKKRSVRIDRVLYLLLSSSFDSFVGFGTLKKTGCRGFTGPIPPPLLIRYSLVLYIVASFLLLSIGFPEIKKVFIFSRFREISPRSRQQLRQSHHHRHGHGGNRRLHRYQ